jgi:hypothetical protein
MTVIDERYPPCLNCGSDMTFFYEGVIYCAECSFTIIGLEDE